MRNDGCSWGKISAALPRQSIGTALFDKVQKVIRRSYDVWMGRSFLNWRRGQLILTYWSEGIDWSMMKLAWTELRLRIYYPAFPMSDDPACDQLLTYSSSSPKRMTSPSHSDEYDGKPRLALEHAGVGMVKGSAFKAERIGTRCMGETPQRK
jgi:hypothetical protein